MSIDIGQVKAILASGPADISFTKADGTVRKMRGTTQADYLPVQGDKTTSTDTPCKNPNLVRVFDLDVNGWRSFDFARLISINPIEVL